MKNLYTFLFVFFFSYAVQAQIAVTGLSSVLATTTNATAMVVDDNLVISGASTLNGAHVSITGNFTTGDILGYNAAALPAGVSASYNSQTGILSFSGTASEAQYQALLRSVSFQATTIGSGSRTILFNIGAAIAYSESGHFYEFVTGSHNWTNAKNAAENKTMLGLQGYLATLTTQIENDFLYHKLNATGWVGGSDDYSKINAATGTNSHNSQSASEGNWYWVTGPEKGMQFSRYNLNPVSVNTMYMNWNPGDPNDLNGEHYGAIFTTLTGKWDDKSDAVMMGYIVEYGGLAGDAAVDLTHSRTIAVGSVLAIKDLIFTASREREAVRLNWSDPYEVDLSGYIIEHSTNGSEFYKIGQINAGPEKNGNYSFQHETPVNGINYYRLRRVTLTNRREFSDTKQVVISGRVIRLYPNPALSEVTVEYPFAGQEVTLLIRTINGVLVSRTILSSNQAIVDLSSLPRGTYFLEFTEGSKSQVQPLVKW